MNLIGEKVGMKSRPLSVMRGLALRGSKREQQVQIRMN